MDAATFFTSLGALLLTLALILGAAIILRRFHPTFINNRPGKPQRLKRLESLPLTPQHTLHIVRVDDREHLILTAPHDSKAISTQKQKP